MPFKSASQHRLFRAKEARGELPKGTASKWAHETPNIKGLPEKKGNPGRNPGTDNPTGHNKDGQGTRRRMSVIGGGNSPDPAMIMQVLMHLLAECSQRALKTTPKGSQEQAEGEE